MFMGSQELDTTKHVRRSSTGIKYHLSSCLYRLFYSRKIAHSSFYQSTGDRIRSLRHMCDIGTNVYLFDVNTLAS